MPGVSQLSVVLSLVDSFSRHSGRLLVLVAACSPLMSASAFLRPVRPEERNASTGSLLESGDCSVITATIFVNHPAVVMCMLQCPLVTSTIHGHSTDLNMNSDATYTS